MVATPAAWDTELHSGTVADVPELVPDILVAEGVFLPGLSSGNLWGVSGT